MDEQDKQRIVSWCDGFTQTGHKYKTMAENPVFKDIFGIQNPKEYALGMILGSYIQHFDEYFKVKYDREMDEEERAFLIAVFGQLAPKIIDSLFK